MKRKIIVFDLPIVYPDEVLEFYAEQYQKSSMSDPKYHLTFNEYIQGLYGDMVSAYYGQYSYVRIEGVMIVDYNKPYNKNITS